MPCANIPLSCPPVCPSVAVLTLSWPCPHPFPSHSQVKVAPKALSPLLARLPADKLLAVELVKGLYFTWKGPMETLDKAGKAFMGLEALLGGSGFQVEGNIWRRQVREAAGVSPGGCRRLLLGGERRSRAV